MRYLTKSRFKMAYECATKLYYEGHKEYVNSNNDDPFLQALAEGGFQVGALAQVMNDGGIEIVERDPDKAASLTMPYLEKDAILFEAALKFESYLVRVDVLQKEGSVLRLKEVKAKSYASDVEFFQKDKKKGILSSWLPYLMDIAFQTHVARLLFPKMKVEPYLVLVNKDVKTSVEGLHQKFKIEKNGRSTRVIIPEGFTSRDVGKNLLIEIDVGEEVEFLLTKGQGGEPIPKLAERFAKIMNSGTKFPADFKKVCKGCEFSSEILKENEKSGFHECMKETLGKNYNESKPLIFNLWNYRGVEEDIENGARYLDDLEESKFAIESPDSGPLETKDRQYLQVEAAKEKSPKIWIDRAGLQREMKKWVYPLHFIDFETCMVAIPFFKGEHPYQQIAFQFSHHVMEKDGSIRHETEFLMPDRGRYPNFEFLRALQSALSKDSGTIFRYSNHENTVLNQIREQILDKGSEVEDSKELLKFIDSVTRRKEGKEVVHEGERCMVDLWDLYKKYEYLPSTEGSNSIKYVLPAILSHSKALQNKYGEAIYGTEKMPSKNFKKHTWLKLDREGVPIDPYKMLKPILEGYSQEELEKFGAEEEGIKNGGSAMMAWAKLQFTETTKAEEVRIRKELLQYCELDTFAMVLIVEHWLDEIKR